MLAPWLGIGAGLLILAALLFSRRTLIVAAVPVVLWAVSIAPVLPAFPGTTSRTDLTIVSQNVRAGSGGVHDSVRALAGAGVLAFTELDSDSLIAAKEELGDDYPHRYTVGTVGIWSKFPLVDAQPLSLGLSWNRALRVGVQTPDAIVVVYVVHAASIRPGEQGDRDTMLRGLASEIADHPAERIIALGDFNAAPTDPALGELRSQLDWAHPTDGTFGFTWPADFPLARIDQVFTRGLDVLSSTTIDAGMSDHRATSTTVAAR